MSLINDALREAKKDAPGPGGNRAQGPDYYPPTPKQGGKGLLIGVIALMALFCVLLVVVMGAVGVFLWFGQKPVMLEPGVASSPEPLVSHSRPAAVPEPPVQPRPPVAGNEPETQPLPPRPVTPETGTTTTAPPDEQPAPITTPAEKVGVSDATEEVMRVFELKGIMKARKGNMALINSSIVRTGDRIKPDGKVMKVTDTEVILRYQGREYRLYYQP